MDPYDFATAKVKEAGEIILDLRKKKFDIATKGGDPRDVVTSIDTDINTFLIEAIKQEFPDHGIYSEEGGGTEGKKEYMWTIDPIDGTSNFSRGIPHYAVCLGLLQNEIPLAGAVYNPITRELFSFKKGGGAFLNGDPVHTSSVTDLSKAQIFFQGGRKPEVWDWAAASYRKLLEHANKTGSFGGSALDICFVAAGRIEVAVYGLLTTRDIGAAFGILTEAGGIATGKNGDPITLSSEPQKFFAANNERILAQLRKFL